MGLDGLAQAFDEFLHSSSGGRPKGYVAITPDGKKVVYDPNGTHDHSIEKVINVVEKTIQEERPRTLQGVKQLKLIRNGLEQVLSRYESYPIAPTKQMLSSAISAISRQLEESDPISKLAIHHKEMIRDLLGFNSTSISKTAELEKFFTEYSAQVDLLVRKMSDESGPDTASLQELFLQKLQEMGTEYIEKKCLPHALKVQEEEILSKVLLSHGFVVSTKDLGNLETGKIFEDLKSKYPSKKSTIENIEKNFSQLHGLQQKRFQEISKKLEEVRDDPSKYFLEVQKAAEKIKKENLIFKDFVEIFMKGLEFFNAETRQSKASLPGLDTAFAGKSVHDLYSVRGICFAACLDFAARKINDSSSELSIQPTAKARFLQVAHELRTGITSGEDDSYDKLIQLKQDLSKESSVKAKCLIRYKMLCVVSEMQYNQKRAAAFSKKYSELEKAKELEKVHYEKLFTELSKQYDDIEEQMLEEAGVDVGIDNQFLKKLGIQVTMPFEEEISIGDFIENLESYIKKIDTEKSPHVLVGLTKTQEVEKTQTQKIEKGSLQDALYLRLAELANIEAKTSQEARDKFLALPKEKKLQYINEFDDKHADEFITDFTKARVGKNAPSQVLSRVEAIIERELKSHIKGIMEPEKRILELGAGHEIYCSFSPPFEIQDVATPGFTSFKTHDINEFKLFFNIWLSMNPYTHVTDIMHITKR
jgi:hypothetical protein